MGSTRLWGRQVAALMTTAILAVAMTTGCGTGAETKETARYKAEDVNVNQVRPITALQQG